MLDTLGALRFLAANTVAPASDEPGQAMDLALADGRALPADLYPARGRRRGLILFVHGMSPMGHRDRRMCRASRALAAAGFDVITPLIPDFQALRIRVGSIDDVVHAALAAAAHPALGAGKPIGVFSISYSAAISLLAACRAPLRGRLSALCAIGTFSDAIRWGRYVVSDPEADEYGRLIVLYNYFERVLGARPAVREALWTALMDHWHKRTDPEFPASLAAMCPEDRALAAALRDDPATWLAVGNALVDAVEEEFLQFNLLHRATQLSAPVVLLHGEGDRVMLPLESVALHEALAAAGKPSRLVVTPLLGHGDPELGLRTLPDGLAVVGGFAEFFRRVAEGRTPSTTTS